MGYFNDDSNGGDIDYLKLMQELDSPPPKKIVNTKLIQDLFKKNDINITLFCFRYNIDNFELRNILEGSINFNFNVLHKIATELNVKVKDLLL